MHDLLTATVIAERRMRELWSGPGSHPYRDHGVARPVRLRLRDRLAGRFTARPVLGAPGAQVVPAA